MNKTRMWADAQRDGHTNIAGTLSSMPQSLADAHCWITTQ